MVNGIIKASVEVLVSETGDWGDFVFADDYNLPSLNEVERFIAKNHHLPGIPSAAEVETNGLGLSDMSNRMMQKIEELTLYIIEQDKRIIEQDKRLNELEKQLEKNNR